MNVKEIIIAHLKSIGADGLVDESGDCGCGIDDFAPCGGCFEACVPAVRRPVNDSANSPADNEGSHAFFPMEQPTKEED